MDQQVLIILFKFAYDNTSTTTILFKPQKDRKKKVMGLYKCPCYIYPIRQGTTENPSYMFSVNLKSGEEPQEFWIKRGAALLMQLDT